MSCKPFKTTEANAKSFLRTKGAIDNFLNILDISKFRQFHGELINQAKKYIPNFSDKLFYEQNGGKKAIPNTQAFKSIDNAKKGVQIKDISLDSQYLEQNPNGSIEEFKSWVDNKNNFDKELAQKIQDKLEKLYPEIKLNITNNPIWEQGDNIFNQEEYNNQVNYRLKATEILLSDKAKQVFEKGKKANWDLNKILTELQIPKEQRLIIIDYKDNYVNTIFNNLEKVCD